LISFPWGGQLQAMAAENKVDGGMLRAALEPPRRRPDYDLVFEVGGIKCFCMSSLCLEAPKQQGMSCPLQKSMQRSWTSPALRTFP